MLRKKLKHALNFLLKGAVLPAISSQLRGVWLQVDPLLPSGLFWNNVEEEVHNAYKSLIKPGNIIFDIGANVGLHSYYISKKISNTTLFAFEPFPENSGYIKKIIALNNFKNITVIEKGIAITSGIRFFNSSKNNHEGHLSENSSHLKIEVTSLDDFIEEKRFCPTL